MYFLSDYTYLSGKEAINWLSQKIGKSFIDYAADLFVELYEKKGAVCDTEPSPERQVMFLLDKRAYLYGIDFGSKTIKIAYASTGRIKRVINYPAEEALKMLGIDWHTLRRSFGVSYLIKYGGGILKDALNKLVKDEVIIKMWGGVMQRSGETIYHTKVMAANPNNIAFRVKPSTNPLLKDLMSFAQIASQKGGIMMIRLLDDPSYRMLYRPADGKIIFHLMESRLPIELSAKKDSLQVIWDHSAWILLSSWENLKDNFEKMKVSTQNLSSQDFSYLIGIMQLRSSENKHI